MVLKLLGFFIDQTFTLLSTSGNQKPNQEIIIPFNTLGKGEIPWRLWVIIGLGELILDKWILIIRQLVDDSSPFIKLYL